MVARRNCFPKSALVVYKEAQSAELHDTSSGAAGQRPLLDDLFWTPRTEPCGSWSSRQQPERPRTWSCSAPRPPVTQVRPFARMSNGRRTFVDPSGERRRLSSECKMVVPRDRIELSTPGFSVEQDWRSPGSNEVHDRIREDPNHSVPVPHRPPQFTDEGVRLGVILTGTHRRLLPS